MTTQVDQSALYGPVADDLPAVDDLLTSLTDVDFPWLREMLEVALGGGGKRMRPAVSLLAGRLGNYDLDLLVPMAASVELLHTATLVHDDVIDMAEERRGRPTAAAQFNNAPSVMLGDYMFAHAAEFVARTGNIRVIRNFADTLRVMATGELNQDVSAYEYSRDVQRYLDRIYGKTASLFATASEGGAIVCGAPEPQVEAVRRYGAQLGMAFQIVDDVLDFSATSRSSASRPARTSSPARSRCRRCSTWSATPRTTRSAARSTACAAAPTCNAPSRRSAARGCSKSPWKLAAATRPRPSTPSSHCLRASRETRWSASPSSSSSAAPRLAGLGAQVVSNSSEVRLRPGERFERPSISTPTTSFESL